eukprot:2083413-Rhodomonas_salina.1
MCLRWSGGDSGAGGAGTSGKQRSRTWREPVRLFVWAGRCGSDVGSIPTQPPLLRSSSSCGKTLVHRASVPS